MKLNDMTLADIDAFAEKKSQEYVQHHRRVAKAAIIEGACWAYEYLTKEGGNESAWCEQKNVPSIRPDLLEKIKALRDNYIRQLEVQNRTSNAVMLITGKLEAVQMVLEMLNE